MTDQTNTPNPNAPQVGHFDPAMLERLPAATKAAFSDMMVKAGYDHSRVEAALDPQPAEEDHVYPEALSPEQSLAASVDRGFPVPVTAFEYDLGPLPDFLAEDDTADVASMVGEIKDGYLAAGVPLNMAAPMTRAFLDAISRFPEGEEARQAYLSDQSKRAIAVAGLSNREEFIRLSDLAQKTLGAVGEQLHSAGAFSTVESLIALVNFGRVIDARSKRK